MADEDKRRVFGTELARLRKSFLFPASAYSFAAASLADKAKSAQAVSAQIDLILSMIGFLLLALGAITFLLERAAMLFGADYTCELIDEASLYRFYPFYARTFEHDAISEAYVRRWLAINPNLLYVVEKTLSSGDSRTIETVGLFSIIPITQPCVELANRNGINAQEFNETIHIARTDEAPAAFYVGVVGAKSIISSAYTMMRFKEEMRRLTRHRPARVFVRPVTADGLRLVKKKGNEFRPVQDHRTKLRDLFYRDFP